MYKTEPNETPIILYFIIDLHFLNVVGFLTLQLCRRRIPCIRGNAALDRDNPVNTKHLYNICTASAQRLRRWSNIVQMLCKCFVLAGKAHTYV